MRIFKPRLALLGLVALGLLSGEAFMLRASFVESSCDGLQCYDGSDCGTACFCNRPSGYCYLNGQ
jgi:hypothetical protein